jgi:hypothetical protein
MLADPVAVSLGAAYVVVRTSEEPFWYWFQTTVGLGIGLLLVQCVRYPSSCYVRTMHPLLRPRCLDDTFSDVSSASR